MREKQLWPGKENPIVSIEFELIVGFGKEGQHVYKRGLVDSNKELEAIQDILEPLQPQPAFVSSKTMGRVDLQLTSGDIVTIRPVFHPYYGVYKDLFKVDNLDCLMPQSFADILNRWRQKLLNQ